MIESYLKSRMLGDTSGVKSAYEQYSQKEPLAAQTQAGFLTKNMLLDPPLASGSHKRELETLDHKHITITVDTTTKPQHLWEIRRRKRVTTLRVEIRDDRHYLSLHDIEWDLTKNSLTRYKEHSPEQKAWGKIEKVNASFVARISQNEEPSKEVQFDAKMQALVYHNIAKQFEYANAALIQQQIAEGSR